MVSALPRYLWTSRSSYSQEKIFLADNLELIIEIPQDAISRAIFLTIAHGTAAAYLFQCLSAE
jgi:hypothetical protein